MTVNSTQSVKAISSYIYGTNDPSHTPAANTLVRLGGNRWTAYNWTNNYSNAGNDYLFENDNALSSSTTPGAAVLPTLIAAKTSGAATLLTIPINGYVAADSRGGDVRYNNNTWNGSTWVSGTYNPNYLAQHFYQEFPNAAANTNNVPNAVYQDQFVNWVNTNAPSQTVFYDLDNEPDIWGTNAQLGDNPYLPGTHQEVHQGYATYNEVQQDNIKYAQAIKNVSPNSMVFGAVNYGWNGYTSLQGATQDSSIKDSILNFQASYLKAMKTASDTAGKRLVDVLDMHWYPEATGVDTTTGQPVRVINNNTNAGVVAARLQSTRSLWDPTYTETSWITQYSTPNEPAQSPAQFKTTAIQLLPREQAIIDTYNPGTKIGISEYQYGASQDISGGVAEADALGIFGQRGVFSANWWSDGGASSSNNFVNGAFKMYLNYDGHGSKFGNTSIGASASNASLASVYASMDTGNANRMVLVLINKSTSGSQLATVNISNIDQFTLADAYQLTSASTNPAHANLLSSSPLNWTGSNMLTYNMLPESVTTLVLIKPQLGDLNLDGLVTGADMQAMLIALKNETSYDTAHNLTLANLAALGDFNHDGVVDAADLAGMQQLLANGGSGGGSLDPVPEPATAGLLAGGVLLMIACRRTRCRRCL
jgi:hypothetical protein